MRTRLFSREDVAGILTVQARSPEAARWTAGDYLYLAADFGGRILVAELHTSDPPKILGFAAFRRIVDEVELLNMAVDPDHRHQGIGRALLEAARDRFLKAGARRLFLEVRVSNKAAIALYSSIGFALHSMRKGYYRDPQEDAYVMAMDLCPPSVISPV